MQGCKFIKSVILLLSIILTNPVCAGSPGGLTVAVIPLPSAISYKQPVVDALNYIRSDGGGVSCIGYSTHQSEQFNLERLYTNKTFGSSIIYGALGDGNEMLVLKNRLRNYRDSKNNYGIDALLTYELKDDEIKFYGISSFEGDLSSLIKLKNRMSENLLN